MNPRDQMIMIGDQFFVFPYHNVVSKTSGRINIGHGNWTRPLFEKFKAPHWPQEFTPYQQLPQAIKDECLNIHGFEFRARDVGEFIKKSKEFNWWEPVTQRVAQAGNFIIANNLHPLLNRIPSNGITRIGKDLYFGIGSMPDYEDILEVANQYFNNYRCHYVTTGGHIDGCFTPVKPGFIVSIKEITTYAKTFPDWEVVYLANNGLNKLQTFLDLKEKNQGRWWIKGHEYDTELIDYVETWLRDWTGYVEESVFDVNILVIDEKNIIVNGYNKQAFDAFERHGVTPHICPMRHRYFWDGGVHCVTLDLDRQGIKQDFFPNRSKT
jgi:hypothetical protein